MDFRGRRRSLEERGQLVLERAWTSRERHELRDARQRVAVLRIPDAKREGIPQRTDVGAEHGDERPREQCRSDLLEMFVVGVRSPVPRPRDLLAEDAALKLAELRAGLEPEVGQSG